MILVKEVTNYQKPLEMLELVSLVVLLVHLVHSESNSLANQKLVMVNYDSEDIYVNFNKPYVLN